MNLNRMTKKIYMLQTGFKSIDISKAHETSLKYQLPPLSFECLDYLIFDLLEDF